MCVYEGCFGTQGVTADVQVPSGNRRGKLPGWWHPGEIKGLGFDI